MAATTVSDWPIPTVSTSTTSCPAASRTIIVSLVDRVTPPRVPALGDGRTKAEESFERRGMRVLSPRMLPPVTVLVGSTARTATRWPSAVSIEPRASMKVLLPTPGTPVMPTRWASTTCGASSSSNRRASTRWSGLEDSTSVTARPTDARSPLRTPSTSSCGAMP